MSVAQAFLKRDFFNAISYRADFAMQFVGILFSVATFYFLSQLFGDAVEPQLEAYGGDYFAFVLIGLAFSGFMGLSLSSFASSIREGQVMGTLEIMLASPTRLSVVLLSSSLWSSIMVIFRVMVFLLVGALIFKAGLAKANILSALVMLILSITSFSSIGILSAAFVLILKKGDPVTRIFGGVSSLLAGVYYPTSVLPDWLEPLSRFLPLTYALDGLRLTILKGYSLSQIPLDLFVLLAFSLVLTPLALLVFRQALRKAKMDGSLTQY
ncbi:MAG: ABC transporter permease [Dehalococcoidales bacterium]|nr:ABC transporter permease [Dehalococcoidales bacterium]